MDQFSPFKKKSSITSSDRLKQTYNTKEKKLMSRLELLWTLITLSRTFQRSGHTLSGAFQRRIRHSRGGHLSHRAALAPGTSRTGHLAQRALRAPGTSRTGHFAHRALRAPGTSRTTRTGHLAHWAHHAPCTSHTGHLAHQALALRALAHAAVFGILTYQMYTAICPSEMHASPSHLV
jgi:hypothetical protein